MNYHKAENILNHWNNNSFDGRVKTKEVFEAEKAILKSPRKIYTRKKKKRSVFNYDSWQRKLLNVYSKFYDKNITKEDFAIKCMDEDFRKQHAPKLDLKEFIK